MQHRARTGVPEADLVLEAARALRRSWGDGLADLDLAPHESRALRVVAGGQQPPRLADIAAALRIAPRSATEVVDRLAVRGLVERRASAADRRAVEVVPTPAGLAMHRQVEEVWRRSAEAFLAPLSAAERTQLGSLLRALIA